MKRSDRAFYLTMGTLIVLMLFMFSYYGKQSMELAESYKERMEIGSTYAELANRHADAMKELREAEKRIDNLTAELRNMEAMIITYGTRSE